MANRPPRTPRAPRTRAAPRQQLPAVEARGEKELTLEGTTYRLRPSRVAVKAIEKETGHALLKLVQLGNGGNLTTDELGIVAAHFIRAGAAPDDDATRHVGVDTIADLIFEEGVMTAQATLTLVLLNAATGGRKVSGEAKAATA